MLQERLAGHHAVVLKWAELVQAKRITWPAFPFLLRLLFELGARKKALEAQMQAIGTRQKERQRKDDTRRKVLVGAAVLAEAEKNVAAKQKLMALLDQHLTREIDRAVFGLEPKTVGQAN